MPYDSWSVEQQRNKERREADPEYALKIKARSAISNGKKYGRITKPSTCDICGCECNPEAHHWHGYAEEHWLDVQWLCKDCHRKETHYDSEDNSVCR